MILDLFQDTGEISQLFRTDASVTKILIFGLWGNSP
ncbi:hypothetical protein NIES3974_42330 [Calothrix sp. NIES-3974]|nr:hypothetical protein NIES3974_42330 [Calothrix sp. NIES-3974]